MRNFGKSKTMVICGGSGGGGVTGGG